MKLEVDNRYLEDIPLRILAQQSVGFSGKLYSPEHEQKFSTEHSEAKLERDPENAHRFILKIDGVSVATWLENSSKNWLPTTRTRTTQRNPPMIGNSQC